MEQSKINAKLKIEKSKNQKATLDYSFYQSNHGSYIASSSPNNVLFPLHMSLTLYFYRTEKIEISTVYNFLEND